MPEIDREILARALRWCAESGRPVHEEAVQAALAPLGWDELLAVKAILADPPPGRDLGPEALLALARGGGTELPDPAPAPSRAAGSRKPRPARVADGPRIRRARDRVEASAPGPVSLPPVDELFQEAGRALLDRLVRRHGANRSALLAALAAGFSREGRPPGEDDLDRLLDHHGLSRGFAERERALVLHAFRKRGGVVPRVAADLGVPSEAVAGVVSRLGLGRQVETIRGERRRALVSQATLSERARILDEQEEALADLGILARFEEELRRRLPEHLRALAVGGRRPSAVDLGRSLSLSRPAVDRLATRFTLDLRPSSPDRDFGGPRGSGPRGPRGPGTRGPRPDGPRADGPRPQSRTGPRSGPRTGVRPDARGAPRGPSRGGPRSAPRGGPRPGATGGTRPPPRAGGRSGPPGRGPRRPGPSRGRRTP